MVDRRDLGSWLAGPGVSLDPDRGYPGERLGRPERGIGSIAGVGRRFAALVIDWLLCLLIVRGLLGPGAFARNGSLWPLAVLVIENFMLVGTAGMTIGQRVLRVRVERLDGSRVGAGAALLRAVLLGLGFPALTLLWQHDGRGLHELASGSLVARR